MRLPNRFHDFIRPQMEILENIDLSAFNTFGVKATAEYFSSFNCPEDLRALTNEFVDEPVFILGGGSNILFTKNVDGLVLHNRIGGIEVVNETLNEVWIKAGAGVVWHDLVMYCVNRNLGGLENLSLIPGSVGAAPMQNIGAYGVEIKDVFIELEAYHLKGKYVRTFNNAECHFGYRESVFKNEFKNQFVILSITCRLSKTPEFNISYGTIEKQLEEMGVNELSVKAVSDAVIAIRQSKLPDPRIVGNAGSFFKNPVVEFSVFEELQKQQPDIPHYLLNEGVKIPAAWLIEQCGFKGYRRGEVGCHKTQPLVIVNFGKATGEEIFRFSEDVIQEVLKRFDIRLSREVNVY